MALYIKIENGKPINHPAFDDNLIAAYGYIPSEWSPFNRIGCPDGLITSPFQKVECTYTLSSDGITWQDNWLAIEMSDEEKMNLISQTQSNPPFPNAVLNTTTLQWKPPSKPTDGNNYTFNFTDGIWEIKT